MSPTSKADLGVEFCGINLVNPFLLASAPPTATGQMITRGFRQGWAGAVTKTLVIDASAIVNVSPRLASLGHYHEEKREIYAFENIELVTDRELSVWLREIEKLRRDHPDRIIIASIMDDASKPDGWQYLARKCEEAGAHIIELNLSCPHGMPERGMGQAIGQDPELSRQVTQWTAQAVQIPVMPKMTPNVTDVGMIARACVDGGARAISAINTVASILGVDLDTMVPIPSVAGRSAFGGLSGPAIKPIALKAVYTIAESVDVPVSGIGGIWTWRDAAEFILLGASTVQVCSAVMARGFSVIDELQKGLSGYLRSKGLSSVRDLIGASLERVVPLMELDTKARVLAHINPQRCIACGDCLISCRDSGYQAIIKSRKRGTYEINESRCTGCALCMQVCPVEGCITMRPLETP